MSAIVDQRQEVLSSRVRALGPSFPSLSVIPANGNGNDIDYHTAKTSRYAMDGVRPPGRHYHFGEAKSALHLQTCLVHPSESGACRVQSTATMVKKRVLHPIPILDEALLLKALREEGIKEVNISNPTTLNLSHRSLPGSRALGKPHHHRHAAPYQAQRVHNATTMLSPASLDTRHASNCIFCIASPRRVFVLGAFWSPPCREYDL